MDKWQRRKIKYGLADRPYFDPFQTNEELKKEETFAAEKEGRFHTWTQVQVAEEGVKSNQILISTYIVIETPDDKLIDIFKCRPWFFIGMKKYM